MTESLIAYMGLELAVRADEATISAISQLVPGSILSAPDRGRGRFRLEVASVPGGFDVCDDLEGMRQDWKVDGDVVQLLAALEPRLAGVAARAAVGGWVLHAGAVATASGAHLILGASGVGKSSVVLEAARAGAPVLGDDLLILGPDGTVQGFPRYLKVDRARGEAVGLEPESTFGFDQSDPEIWVDPTAVGGSFHETPLSIARVLAVQYSPESDLVVRRLTPAETLVELVAALVDDEGADALAFEALANIAEASAGWAIRSGDSKATAKWILGDM